MTGFIAGSRPALTLFVLTACAVLVTGCGGSPTEHTEPDSSQPQLAVVTPPMEAGVVALLNRWTDAWSAMDAPAFAAVYTQDADFVNPLGAVTPGRAAIEAAHTFLFGSLFAGSRQTWEIRRLVPVTGNFVLVDLNVELAGFQATPPGLLVSPDGVVRTRARLTVVRGKDGIWEIESQQLTAYVP